MIILEHNGVEKKFTPKQALNIMHIQHEMKTKDGWKLPENSPYEYKDNAFITRTDTADCQGQAPEEIHSKGNKSSAKAKVPHSDNTVKA